MKNVKTIALYVVGALITIAVAMSAISSSRQADTEKRERYEARKSERLERFRQGSYVGSDKEIAPGERIRVVVIPSKDGDFFDTRCVLYTNLAAGTSSITCPESLGINE